MELIFGNRIFRIAICLLFTNNVMSQNLIPNGDFELGLASCYCPTGFNCYNDASRVEDGVDPLFSVGQTGCILQGINYTNTLGAHSGVGYVYFYAGADNVVTDTNLNFTGDSVEMCVWYAGPQGQGASGQNTSDAHFSFAVDGVQVGSDILVPVNTVWTQTCFTLYIPPGSHNFGILSGGLAQYSMWFDDFSVEFLNPPNSYFNAGDTSICEKFCTDFFDQSTNDPTAWQWSFPGAIPSFSADQNPGNICYNVPGIYDVTLITTNANGSDTLALLNYITVYSTPPAPAITQTGNVLTCSPASAYQWQLNSLDIPGATQQSYTYTQTGLYSVLAYDSNGCSNFASILITGIGKLISEFEFSIYPNPTSGKFIAEIIPLTAPGCKVYLRIENTVGQVIFFSEEKTFSGFFRKEIDLGDFPVGIYYIDIRCGDRFFKNKFVIAK